MAVSNSETKPAGQAYFVSDGTPIENFEFLRPLCVARGRRYPLVVLPVNFMVCVSYFMELLYHATARLGYGVSPLLTRAEVYKVGVTHYFSISKAQEELGYRPAITSIDGANRIAKHYEENMPVGENFFEVPDLYWWILIITGLVMLGIVAYDPNCCSETSLMSGVKWLALTIFREQIVVQVVFWLAMAAHVGEAIYASNLAYHHCHNKWILWGIQTFITGFASLRLLLNHCKDAQQLRILNNETRQSTYNALSETDTNTAEE